MLQELEHDIANGELYISPRLSEQGKKEYPGLLRAAIENGNDVTLANALRSGGRLKTTEERKTKTRVTTAKVPVTAPETLAEGELIPHSVSWLFSEKIPKW